VPRERSPLCFMLRALVQSRLAGARRPSRSQFKDISNRSFLPSKCCWCYRIFSCAARSSNTKGTTALHAPLLDGEGSDNDSDDVRTGLEYVAPRSRVSRHISEAVGPINPPRFGSDDDSSISSIVSTQVHALMCTVYACGAIL